MSSINAAYESYSRWLDKGNRDLILPAFKMTSRQMFWFAAVHVLTETYQRRISPIFEIWPQLTKKYMHVLLKNTPAFRTDFACGTVTTDEMILFNKYQDAAGHLEKINRRKCPEIFTAKFSRKGFDDFEKNWSLRLYRISNDRL